ncbi:30S ribosomal protein S1, partial [Amycolatopsis sp. H6(2020)]|nr:30S ribosomal protein S1 [Amycolatopsis sp. H6(2020)]
SLKQANEGVDPDGTEFDPALYGMAAEYDEQGNYKYPEGFDPETNEWLEGYEAQRAAWEQEYANAQARWEAHKEQVRKALNEDADAAASAATGGRGGSSAQTSYSSEAPASDAGTLASDEALAALREKLTGGNN